MDKLKVEAVPCKHHRAGFLVVDDIRILKIHHSHGVGDMPPTVAHLFRKSLKLSVAEFQRLIGCTLSRESYIEILRAKGCVGRTTPVNE
jgi:hypothetical protein